MKTSKRIICSILIILSIVCMFLPVATSVDNRVEQLRIDIRKKEDKLNRKADTVTNHNNVESEATSTTEEDRAMQAEVEAAKEKVTDAELAIKALKDFIAGAGNIEIDDAFKAEVKSSSDAAEARRTNLENELPAIKEAQEKLEKALKEIQAARAFIEPVETEDAEGLPLNLAVLLQEECEENPDVFAELPEVQESFDKWKVALIERYEQLQVERKSFYLYDGEGRLLQEALDRYNLGTGRENSLPQVERDLVYSIMLTDEFIVTMIKIVRQQAAINAMAADPASDPEQVEKVQKAQDRLYKDLKAVNKEQDVVAEILAKQEEVLAGDPIPDVYYSLLPSRLPVPDNRTVELSASIKELEAEIKKLQAELAPLDEVLQHATDSGLKAVQSKKQAADDAVLKLSEELKALEDAVLAETEALAKYDEGKPQPAEEEAVNLESRAAKKEESDKLTADVAQLKKFIDAAENVVAKDEAMKDALDPVIAHAKKISDELTAKTETLKSEIDGLSALLADYDGLVKAFEDARVEYTDKVSAAEELVTDKQAEIEAAVAEVAEVDALLAQITGDALTANQAKKAELDKQLAKVQAKLEYVLADQTAHRLYLGLDENVLQVDMQIVNSWGALYPTNFADFNIATWVALILLVIALVLLWIPGNQLVSKCYTFSSFANLAAVLLLAYSLLRLMALPIAQPYGNPNIIPYVAIPMLVMPLIALLLHSSSVTNTKRTMIYVLCIAFCVLSLLPFWLMMVNATRSTQEIQQGVSLIPSSFLSNNWNILQSKNFDVLLGFKNSAIIAFGSTFLSVYFSALTAYGLTVYKFKGAKFLYAVILAIIMIPGQVTGTGFFMFMYQLEWTNSYLPLIIPAIASASTVFFFKQYLEANFQVSLVEAARIDGAGEFYTYNRIVLPIMVPAMATMGIMAVIGSWNNYLTPLMLLSKAEMKTLPMMVKELRGDIYRTEYGSIYLGLTLTAMPLLIVYFLFSKYIIAGVAVGGVKE